ncbi:MAG: ribonuclease J [Peptostreptococcaceae bacterium]|nr:ribonuclease J [Peptostreptococcaceae bacterium]
MTGNKPKNNLKIIPLGGLNEIGKNMTVFEYKDEIVIVDCGLAFPDNEMLGIDLVIPDVTYLENNKDKIKGIVLTHGHEDHIGGLPFFLKKINVPIYGTNLTIGLVANKLREHKLDKKVKTHVRKAGDIITLGRFKVELIRVGHSIPDAVGLLINTPVGKIIHTGDFKIDFTPIDGDAIDLNRFAEIGSSGVLALMADSTNVERPGYTMSEKKVGKTFDRLFASAEKRIIVASFSSNVHRLQQIVNAAALCNRKIAFSGRSMVNMVKVATELGYINIPEGIQININDISRYPDNEIVVATTGSQGEPMSALVRMANAEHRQMTLQKGDTVIMSSSAIPGNEKTISNIINLLYEKGVDIIYEDTLDDIHVSGHACQEELKLIHSLVKPKYFIPVHGEYRHLARHAKLAEELGMSENNIFIGKNGNVIEINKDFASMTETVPSGIILVDGLGVGDVGNIVLKDRKVLSEDGLMVVVVTLSKKENKIISGPDIISRGFVYVRESEDLMDGSRKVVSDALEDCLSKNTKEWSTLKSAIRDSLGKHLYNKTKRNPMILPIITEI